MEQVQNSSAAQIFASGNEATGSVRKGVDESQDRFLKLLVTQMQNQDPLNPLDNAEVTSQLAQISTVTGIDKLNDTLKLMVSDLDAMRSLEATSMIGHGVLVEGSSMRLEDNVAIAGIELPQPVDELVISIQDSSGITIRNMALGAQPEGIKTFAWDGVTDSGTAAANGNYSFTVNATQGDNDISATALALATVNSVSPDEKGAILDVGELGFIGMSDIKQIF